MQWQRKKSEWKNTKIWKAKGKVMDTNTGGSPGYQSQSQEPRNSPSEEVRGHWTSTGTEPMHGSMDGMDCNDGHLHANFKDSQMHYICLQPVV